MARPRSDIAPRVVAAARSRFLAQGVDGASLREIARAAKTSIGMVYYYFPTKDHLLLAVIEEVYAGLVTDLEVALLPSLPVAQRLERMFARAAAMSDAELTVIRIVLREALVSSVRLRKIFRRFSRGHLQLVSATLMEGMASGEVRRDLPPLLILGATMALGLLPVIARRLALGAAPRLELPSAEELTKDQLRALFEGIGGPKARRKKR